MFACGGSRLSMMVVTDSGSSCSLVVIPDSSSWLCSLAVVHGGGRCCWWSLQFVFAYNGGARLVLVLVAGGSCWGMSFVVTDGDQWG